MSRTEAARTSYDSDFIAWTVHQAGLLRERRSAGLDTTHLAEEIEDLGISVRRQLESRLEILILHLLKWHFQPALKGRSWELSIKEQRRQLKRLFGNNPSLGAMREEALLDAYGGAILRAELETGLPRSSFPPTCNWTVEQVLDDAFWPGSDAPAS